MEKEYDLSGGNPKKDVVEESAIEYRRQPVLKIKCSPPLTDEELKNAITGDELLESAYKFIDELFDRDENSVH